MIIVLTGLTIAERRKTPVTGTPAFINKIARCIAGRTDDNSCNENFSSA
jgi:hypothetical protein